MYELTNDIDIDAFWGELRPASPDHDSWSSLISWVQSSNPVLDVSDPFFTSVRSWFRNRPDALIWDLGTLNRSLLGSVLTGLKWRHTHPILGAREWSYLGAFVEHSTFEMLLEVEQAAKLYKCVMEVKFAFDEQLPWSDVRNAICGFTQHLEDNPEEGLLFYRWCHLNEYVPRTILVLDAYNRASPDENADVERILTYAGAALGVVRGHIS